MSEINKHLEQRVQSNTEENERLTNEKEALVDPQFALFQTQIPAAIEKAEMMLQFEGQMRGKAHTLRSEMEETITADVSSRGTLVAFQMYRCGPPKLFVPGYRASSKFAEAAPAKERKLCQQLESTASVTSIASSRAHGCRTEGRAHHQTGFLTSFVALVERDRVIQRRCCAVQCA